MSTKKEQKIKIEKSQEKNEVEKDVVKDYYEAESWQFSGCGD